MEQNCKRILRVSLTLPKAGTYGTNLGLDQRLIVNQKFNVVLKNFLRQAVIWPWLFPADSSPCLINLDHNLSKWTAIVSLTPTVGALPYKNGSSLVKMDRVWSKWTKFGQNGPSLVNFAPHLFLPRNISFWTFQEFGLNKTMNYELICYCSQNFWPKTNGYLKF